MDKELKNLAAWSVETAKSAGADDCRVSVNNNRLIEISYRDHKPENIKEASQNRLSIEVYVNNRFSAQNTQDLRKKSLKEFITNAVATTRLLAEDKYRSLPDPRYYEGRKNIDLGLVDPEYKNFTPEDRHNIVKTIEDSCLKNGGEKVISVTATVNDGHDESIILTSNGFEGHQEATFYVAVAEMTVQDQGDRRPAGYDYCISVNKKNLPPPERIGENAAKRTLSLLGCKKIKTEILPIIIENRNVRSALGGFLAGMNGSNIQQKRSFLVDKKGQKVGSKHFSIIDDPFIEGGLDSRLFDGDGFAAKKMKMIENGVLNDYYIDWYYSRKLGWEPTTGSPSNIIIPPGKRSVNEIMKDLGRGILITRFIGGNSNSTTGDYSVGIFGQLFENGQAVQPVSEMNIAGNHLEFWHKLAEVANDPWLYGAQTPSLVFTDVVVSGL
jgi:PmbA protein